MTSKSPKYPLSAGQIAAYYIEEHSRPGSARVYVLDPTRFATDGQDWEPERPAAVPAAPAQLKEASAEPSHRLELGNIVIVLGAARALPRCSGYRRNTKRSEIYAPALGRGLPT
jgi:hypothetical protein